MAPTPRSQRPTSVSKYRQQTEAKAVLSSKTPQKPPSKKSRAPKRKAKGKSKISEPAWISPKNPQATLQGLPAELRLLIYTFLTESSIIHIHCKNLKGNKQRFTSTPCKSPNPKCPLLCENPKWSGLCKEEDRCTYKVYAPPEPLGFWGLAATCKFIRREASEFFTRNTVYSLHPSSLRYWIRHLRRNAPKQLANLRRITLAGPPIYNAFNSTLLQGLIRDVPFLEAVGLQMQEPTWNWIRDHHNPTIDLQTNWRNWNCVHELQAFKPTITVAAEGLIWLKGRRVSKYKNPTAVIKEQQFVVRLIREGNGAYEGLPGVHAHGRVVGWTEDDVKLEVVQPGVLAEPRRDAQWRIWWKEHDMNHEPTRY